MTRQVVIGQLRVQKLMRRDGRRSWTIVSPEGTVHVEADRFLRVHDGSGTQKTYAYYLVDHLRWLERECLTFDRVGLRDLERYMGIVGADVRMPLGEPWRTGKPAPVLAWCRRGAREAARCLPAAITGGPAPLVPGACEVRAARQPAHAAGSASAASEDAARRRPGEAAGHGEHGPGPAGGDLAG